jgi:probable H4MPT-linked C1 transfer pathway protein
MTGELADCFRTKAEGVREIVDSLDRATGARRLRVYLTSGEFVPPSVAVSRTGEAAASNWHALARFAARFAEGGAALVLDIGSTTTDVIPILEGKVVAQGVDDTTRLIHGELVYTGVDRTPLATVVDVLPWHGHRVPVARELFATTRDAYVILEEMPELPGNNDTADGRPSTRSEAQERMARIICADRETFDETDAFAAAEYVRQSQTAQIGIAARRVMASLNRPPSTIVISGSGEFLARRVVERLGGNARIVSLSETLGQHASNCAAAHAVAVLAREGADS